MMKTMLLISSTIVSLAVDDKLSKLQGAQTMGMKKEWVKQNREIIKPTPIRQPSRLRQNGRSGHECWLRCWFHWCLLFCQYRQFCLYVTELVDSLLGAVCGRPVSPDHYRAYNQGAQYQNFLKVFSRRWILPEDRVLLISDVAERTIKLRLAWYLEDPFAD